MRRCNGANPDGISLCFGWLLTVRAQILVKRIIFCLQSSLFIWIRKACVNQVTRAVQVMKRSSGDVATIISACRKCSNIEDRSDTVTDLATMTRHGPMSLACWCMLCAEDEACACCIIKSRPFENPNLRRLQRYGRLIAKRRMVIKYPRATNMHDGPRSSAASIRI